ncbi:hypothetical protein P5P81_02775 [Tritonibacter mobilis]|nr:hypothetical protein [Tritonibacter mobilis]
MSWFRDLGVRVRLSAALAVMFGLMVLVSGIGLRVLDRTEVWMNVLHRDTLTEVEAAMDLSRDVSELATSAPFLFALFAPYQLEQEVAAVMENLERVRQSSGNDPELDLPLARLGLAIENLAQALLPQSARQAELKAIDRALVRLNARSRRMSQDDVLPLEAQQDWGGLQQLTSVALGAARSEELIELGGFARDFQRLSGQLQSLSRQAPRETYDEISKRRAAGAGCLSSSMGTSRRALMPRMRCFAFVRKRGVSAPLPRPRWLRPRTACLARAPRHQIRWPMRAMPFSH